MGVINVTPDSFSDGGKFNNTDAALLQALELIQQGADIIDIGGESSRPGADTVSVDEEINRVIPVIEKLRKENPYISISIDTVKAKVMQSAIDAGANFINDINALQNDGCLEIVAESGLPVCLMHKLGLPKTMQEKPNYKDVLIEVLAFFKERVNCCLSAGIKSENIILDPGIGFGKTLEHNLALLKNIKQLKSLGFPILIGASRKTMIGEILDSDVNDRLYGSLAVAQFAYTNGAEYLRVHDVKATADVLKTVKTLCM
ncbi:MAG: dihydropteroate synthase [Alcanivoracaceae bacterium]|nr:dihydropteroate synthase [Alcanivoracaceae bacterium]